MAVGWQLTMVLAIGIGLAFDYDLGIAALVLMFLGVLGSILLGTTDRKDKRFRQRAVRATARVLGVEPTRFRVNKQLRIHQLRMRVTLPGQPTFVAIHRALVHQNEMSRVEPGSSLSVRVDPERLHELEIDW